MDFVFFSKVLPPFIQPLGFCLALLFIAMFISKIWLKNSIIALSVIILLIASNGNVSRALFKNLERQHMPFAVEADVPKADVIIVLGGGLGLPLPPRNMPNFGGGADRFIYAAKLYKAGVAPKILISGGNVFAQDASMKTEAYYTKQILVEFGINADDILIETQSRNTFENAFYSKAFMEDNDFKNAILVTSAFHMRRSAAIFQTAGINIVAAPTDFSIVDSHSPKLIHWLPKAGSLSGTTAALREHIGYWIYYFRGYIKKDTLEVDDNKVSNDIKPLPLKLAADPNDVNSN